MGSWPDSDAWDGGYGPARRCLVPPRVRAFVDFLAERQGDNPPCQQPAAPAAVALVKRQAGGCAAARR